MKLSLVMKNAFQSSLQGIQGYLNDQGKWALIPQRCFYLIFSNFTLGLLSLIFIFFNKNHKLWIFFLKKNTCLFSLQAHMSSLHKTFFFVVSL